MQLGRTMTRSHWLPLLTIVNIVIVVKCIPTQQRRQVSPSVWNIHRDLGTRLEAFDGENLICQVTDDEEDNEIAPIDFNFWYAMGVDQPLDMMELLQLEHELFRTIEDSLLWCWGDGDTFEEAESHNNSGRALNDDDTTRRQFTMEARDLGIIAFSVGGMDEHTALECPETTTGNIQETGSTNCIVVRGQMRIIAHAGNNVTYAIASIRDGLQEAMQNSTFVSKLGLAFIRFLQYLGDSEESALLPFVENTVLDADGDGVEDITDLFPTDPLETIDSDGDGVGDNSDRFPNDPNQTAIAEEDGVGENPVDSDGDTISDSVDLFPNDPTEHKDKDEDGVGNNADAFPCDPDETVDTDADGVGDNSDAFPKDPKENKDADGDGVGDNTDAFPIDPDETADSDGDGVGDNADEFPNDPNETTDSDGDGVGDNADAFPDDSDEAIDTDGDGVGDNSDAFPNDPNETTDSDGDGVGDNKDVFPNNPDESVDSDGDAVGDNSDAFPKDSNETTDSDGDGVGDNTDTFPNDPNESIDSDGDGVGNNVDAFPYNATETIDSDADEVGDNADAFPDDPDEAIDTDGDGRGDNADAFPNDAAETTDSDGDGVGDTADAFPNDPNETVDSDGDGVGDKNDMFPRDPYEWQDSDNDGVGDNGDAYPYDGNTTQDNRNGTDPIAAINQKEKGDDRSVPLMLAFGLPLILILFLVGLFADKKKTKKAVAVSARNGVLGAHFVLVGTSDPPNSYHDGLYHHLHEGTRYLSTCCAQCLETRKNSFYTDENLGTIREDEVYDDNVYGMDGFSDSSSSDVSPTTGLAVQFTGMDVHKCNSALCQRCTIPKRQKIRFLSTCIRAKDHENSTDNANIPFPTDNEAQNLAYFSERSEV